MKRILILCIVIIICCSCTFTSRYSKPYSAGKAASLLEKHYGIEIELIDEIIIRRSPFAENQYIYKDINRDFCFTVNSKIEKDLHFPVIHRTIYDNYQTALMFHYSGQAVALSNNYAIKFIPVENIRQEPIEKIYIHGSEQLFNVSELFFKLKKLYNYNYPKMDSRINSSYSIYSMKLHLYYLPKENNNIEDAKYIWYFAYRNYTDKEELYSSLKRWWNEKMINDKIF